MHSSKSCCNFQYYDRFRGIRIGEAKRPGPFSAFDDSEASDNCPREDSNDEDSQSFHFHSEDQEIRSEKTLCLSHKR